MRKKFEQEYSIGILPISQVQIPKITRDELPPVLKALQHIFVTPDLNKSVFKLLEKAIPPKKRGRKGMDLWQILVLAVVRNTLDTNYDRLHDNANHHSLIRKIMGVECQYGIGKTFGLQTIKDNVRLLDVDTIKQIDALVVDSGHQLVKKKENELLRIKIDTYALETNVHFPTDLSLLWDSARKCIETIESIVEKYALNGWRKSKSWKRELKRVFRISSRSNGNGGKNKEERLCAIVEAYLNLARNLDNKISSTFSQQNNHPSTDFGLLSLLISLEDYRSMLVKHIDLVERRILKGETIPHKEKIFSIFERHTEWLQKGKKGRKSVELGHNVLIATDQYNFIVYHQVIEGTSDADLAVPVADALLYRFGDFLYSLSYDKGFSSKDNKDLISLYVPVLVMPKKGKLNQQEREEETDKEFKKLRNAHSAIESNINQLEHNGLNTCPDKGIAGFKRYAAIGVLSYNLHRLGSALIKEEKKKEEKKNKLSQAA